MRRILVLLVSDQTVPNFLFIKSFDNVDKYLFITTDKMENENSGNKRKWLLTASGIAEEKQDFRIVDAELKSDVISKIQDFDWDNYTEIIVNVTGGTKMMSIACYEFFKNITKNIWYLPIGKNTYHLCDEEEQKLDVHYKMSVEEYLDCCGIFKSTSGYSEKCLTFDKDFTDNFFESFNKKLISQEKLEEIRILFRSDDAPYARQMNKKKEIDLQSNEEFNTVIAFLKEISFPIQYNILSKEKMEYLTGGWFEEYVYNIFKTVIQLDDTYFKLGVVLNPKPKSQEKLKYFTNNDLDVVFVYNNILYVVECKSGGMDKGDLYNKTVYLASALRKYFGLSVKSILCTLSKMTEDKIEKANTLGITVFDSDDFVNGHINEKIKNLLK